MPAVAGYDVMNEPNAFDIVRPPVLLTRFYGRALDAIRAAESEAGAPRRLFLFEPSILWAGLGVGVPLARFGDDQTVYAPHIYQGGLDDQPLDESVFQKARDEAARFGGVPVLTGEWGSDPRRAADPMDDYFDRHQALQDDFRFGATLWTWREACGDPHKAGDVRDGVVPYVWGLFEVDCATNEGLGMRQPLVEALRRPLVRGAPGRLTEVSWTRETRHFVVRGGAAPPGGSLLVFHPARPGEALELSSDGLQGVHARPAPGGGRFVAGVAQGGDWTLEVAPRFVGHVRPR